MKALFVGLGSIGQRHLQNLKEIDNSFEIAAYRKSQHNSIIINGKVTVSKKTISEYYQIKEFKNYAEALSSFAPNIVFITNPTSMHVKYAIKAIKAGAHIFLEKPISHNLGQALELKLVAEKNNRKVFVGYQMRFHPLYIKLKQHLANPDFGKVVAVNSEWGTYLPFHHKYEDYTKSYAALKSLGGGVTLGLIHEIDMILDLFGDCKSIMAMGGRVSDLAIDADDTISALLKTEKCIVSLFLSYAQITETRTMKIMMNNATLFFDIHNGTLKIYDHDSKLILDESPRFERNLLFSNEMKAVLEMLKSDIAPMIDINQGIASLKVATAIINTL